MGVSLMLATIVAALVACVLGVAAGYFRIPTLLRVTQFGLLTWGVVYTALLFGLSLSSHEHLLGRGGIKRFCGFYLDCHMGAAVVDVRRTDVLGLPPNEVRAAGEFYVVTVMVISDARVATLSLADPTATVVDAAGRRYSRSIVGEHALVAAVGPAIPLNTPLLGDSHFTTPLVFDLPRYVVEPRLLLTDTPGLAGAVEGVLIGDEDSVLHKRTYFALTANSSEIARGWRP
jgi:hypothetical protein